MTEKDEDHQRKFIICWFWGKDGDSRKVRDHRHLTGKYKGQADGKCVINVQLKNLYILALSIHNFNTYDCDLCFKKLVNKRWDNVELKVIPRTTGDSRPVYFGCSRFWIAIDFHQVVFMNWLTHSLKPSIYHLQILKDSFLIMKS